LVKFPLYNPARSPRNRNAHILDEFILLFLSGSRIVLTPYKHIEIRASSHCYEARREVPLLGDTLYALTQARLLLRPLVEL